MNLSRLKLRVCGCWLSNQSLRSKITIDQWLFSLDRLNQNTVRQNRQVTVTCRFKIRMKNGASILAAPWKKGS